MRSNTPQTGCRPYAGIARRHPKPIRRQSPPTQTVRHRQYSPLADPPADGFGRSEDSFGAVRRCPLHVPGSRRRNRGRASPLYCTASLF